MGMTKCCEARGGSGKSVAGARFGDEQITVAPWEGHSIDNPVVPLIGLACPTLPMNYRPLGRTGLNVSVPIPPAQLRASVDGSLSRLRIETIDILQRHFPTRPNRPRSGNCGGW